MNRLLAFSALPLVLAAGLVGAGGVQRTAAAAAQPGTTCLLGILCLGGGSPSPSASPSPSPASTSPAPSTSPTGMSPSPAGVSPSPTASPSGRPSPGPSTGPTASGSPSPSAGPTRSGGTGASGKHATAAAGLVAATATSVLTAGAATLANFQYVGTVNMPVTGGGTVTMMEFTADTITLSGGVTFSVTQNGVTAVESSSTLAFSGAVTLYATQLSGSVLGLQLTFTPSTASTIVLQLINLLGSLPVSITLTNVTTDQPLVTAGSVVYTPLSLGFGG